MRVTWSPRAIRRVVAPAKYIRIIYRVFAGEKVVVLTVRHGRQLLSRNDVEG
jgi:plasmid stabilization system protein ParE